MVHASLFSGIGGPEVAAAMLGWENAFHCEINPFGRKILEYWFPESKSYENIITTDFSEWRGKIDVLTGGFPCQPFSYAGKRGGREDERYLWPQMLRAIDEIRPTWVVGENVAGITTMGESGILVSMGSERSLFGEDNSIYGYELRESFTIERICSDLEKIGYTVQPMLIPAASVGAPHRRDRIFILAHVTNTNGGGSGEIPAEIYARFPDGNEPLSAGREWSSADSDCARREKSQQSRWEKDSEKEGARLDNRTKRSCHNGDVANTFSKRLSTAIQSGLYGQEERYGSQRPAEFYSYNAWLEGSWWYNFPTVSPVHRGNDGLPFSLDDLTISATKWRTESLKAYGNAIVPQVMFRIFQAIEEVMK